MKELYYALEKNQKLHGLYIGEVVNTIDLKNRNRVQVKINGITDEVDDDINYLWAEQGGPIAYGSSDTVGISTSPSKGEMVYIMFLNGSASHPVYFAIVRGGNDASDDYNGNYVIHTPDGQKIIIGKNTLKLINGGSSVEITNTDVTITATNVNINSSSLKHNGTNVGDTHVHNEPNSLPWSASSETSTDVPN